MKGSREWGGGSGGSMGEGVGSEGSFVVQRYVLIKLPVASFVLAVPVKKEAELLVEETYWHTSMFYIVLYFPY